MGGYNKWYIVDLVVSDLALNDTDVDYIEGLQETVLDDIASVLFNMLLWRTMLLSILMMWKHLVIIFRKWTPMSYALAEPYVCCECNPSQIIPEETYVWKAKSLDPLCTNSFWYHDLTEALPMIGKNETSYTYNFDVRWHKCY